MSRIRALDDPFGELVPPVAPLTFDQCVELGEGYGESVLGIYLNEPVNWSGLIEERGGLSDLGLIVYPVSSAELDGHDAATELDSEREGEVNMLLRVDHHENVNQPSSAGNYARSTVLHEIVHGLVHVPYLRRVRATTERAALRRFARRDLHKTRDPEWQAWTIGAAIRMPRRQLAALSEEGLTVAQVAQVAQLSEKYTTQHLRNLGLLGRFGARR